MKPTFIILCAALLFGQLSMSQPFNNQVEWESYFKNNNNSLDPIEGMWSSSVNLEFFIDSELSESKNLPQFGICAVYKSGEYFDAYFLSNRPEDKPFQIYFIKTAIYGIYLINCYFNQSSTTAKANAVLTDGSLLEFSFYLPDAETERMTGGKNEFNFSILNTHQWIKLFPTEQDITKSNSSYGTGFALTPDGLIVTNNHVIDNAVLIKVRGVNGDFSEYYTAKVFIVDEANDIAIIKVDDDSFSTLGTPPYTIKPTNEEVGATIFVLGYPLTNTMGNEIKLTNGLISANSGYQGDETSYQISAPIQAGNSGAPLFDNDGFLIGIINAKHSGAENVGYAIKSTYLNNTIESFSQLPMLPSQNLLVGKSLIDQVKLIKKFVYIIEVN